MKKGISFSALIFICISFSAFSTANAPLKIALLKYGGGGDWYANPTSLTNLIRFVNKEMNMGVDQSYSTVEVGSADIFNFPFVHMTGHGNVVFSELEAQNLRLYLLSGGFLHFSIEDITGIERKKTKYIKEHTCANNVFPSLGGCIPK